MKKGAFICAAAMLCVACTMEAAESETTGRSEDAIVGGADDAVDPAVVALYARVPGATTGSLCTGEVISPTVVLTAAHCVTEVAPGSVHYVIPGAKFQSVPSSEWLAVKEAHADPAFDSQHLEAGHDIAVVILAKPTTIRPLRFLQGTLPPEAIGQRVRLVGYGLDNGLLQTGAGTKRTVTVPVVSMDDLTLETGNLFQKACNGDSGGPALLNIDGEETIVGVTSYGFIFCLFDAFYTRVDRYSDFITQYL